jgi:hypothetical protein
MMGELFGFIWCAIAGLRLPPTWVTPVHLALLLTRLDPTVKRPTKQLLKRGEGPSQDHAAVWLPTGHVRESVMHWQD